jgi:hypothetical protein
MRSAPSKIPSTLRFFAENAAPQRPRTLHCICFLRRHMAFVVCNPCLSDAPRLFVRGRWGHDESPIGQSHRARQDGIRPKGFPSACIASALRTSLFHNSNGNYERILTDCSQTIIERAVAKGLGLGKGGEEACSSCSRILLRFHSPTS